MEKLKLSNSKFNRLCVISNVYPVIADKKHSYDNVDGWYYKIDDIKRMFYSNAYEVLNKNYAKDERREEFNRLQQFSRAMKIEDDEVNFVELVKDKYPSLGQSLEDLGNSLRNLYFIQFLAIEDVEEDLKSFEEFIIRKGVLNRAFLSKKGVYFSFNCEKIIVCWFIPYPGTNLHECVEEKTDEYEEKVQYNFDFLDFGSLSSEEELEKEEKCVNDPNKYDISLLKYSLPLLKMHLKLSIFKLERLLPDKDNNLGIFKNLKIAVLVKSIRPLISFVIRACGRNIVDYNDAELVITEIVEDLRENVKYLQPQYIFDCLNQSKLLPFDDYAIGKSCPPHISPFPDVLDIIDERAVKTLSNKKKYEILDKVESLD